jgi:hypothetical protein
MARHTLADYEIRLFREDGASSLIVMTSAANVEAAKATALPMITKGIGSAEIWLGGKLVGTMRASDK